MTMSAGKIFCVCLFSLLTACAGPTPGPDKGGAGLLSGAASGAGAGAITGFQVGAGTGPGADIGAGFGAVAGSLSGLGADQDEEALLKLSAETRRERERSVAHEILQDQFARRMQLHPTRDIYPADLFFLGDESELRPDARVLVRELGRMNKERLSWSRLAVVSYVKTSGKKSDFARHLATKRAREICNHFVQAGLEPRRVEGRGVMIAAPLLIDPADRPDRYNQAIEIVPLDR